LVTLEMVALAAGVSPSTVSRILNSSSGTSLAIVTTALSTVAPRIPRSTSALNAPTR